MPESHTEVTLAILKLMEKQQDQIDEIVKTLKAMRVMLSSLDDRIPADLLGYE